MTTSSVGACTGRRLLSIWQAVITRKINMLSKKKFDDWLNKSTTNNKIVYYRGYLCGSWLQKLSPIVDQTRVRAIQRHVYSAYELGAVTLVQKKHADFDYEYIAVRV